VVEELQALHAAVRVLCTNIDMPPANLGKAAKLNAQSKSLDYADVAVLVTLANNGSLRALTSLNLGFNQIGDAGMGDFSRAFASGSMGELKHLYLSENVIGDAGMIKFSEALGKGSLPACATILVEDGNPGNTAPLEAACEERRIVCM
jgi:hypothetical protein